MSVHLRQLQLGCLKPGPELTRSAAASWSQSVSRFCQRFGESQQGR